MTTGDGPRLENLANERLSGIDLMSKSVNGILPWSAGGGVPVMRHPCSTKAVPIHCYPAPRC